MEHRGSTFLEGVAKLEGLAGEGHDDDALAVARPLLEQAVAGLPAEMPVASAANRLGCFFSNRSFDAEARRACLLALDLLERTGRRDNALLSSIHNNLGQLEARGDDLEAAELHLETALALGRGGSAHPAENAYTADNLAAVLTRRGRLDRAEKLHGEALEVLRGLGPRYRADVATVLGNLGILYHRRGDPVRAQAAYLRAIDTHLGVGTLESGDARIPLINLIDLLLERGDEPLADEMTDWLLRAGGESGAVPHQVAMALFRLGTAAFGRAQLGLAERVASRALSLLETIAGRSAPQTVRAIQLLANVHAAKGNLDRAEQSLLRLLDIPDLGPAKTAELLIDLGKSMRQSGPGSYPAAIGIFDRAIRLLRKQADSEPRLLASALGNLGELYFLADEDGRADALYREALSLRVGSALGDEHPWLLHCRALLHYHLGRYDDAQQGMRQALRIWRRRLGGTHAFLGTVNANLALVHWARGDFGSAQRAFARAQKLREGNLQRTLMVGTERERLEAAQHQQDALHKRVSFCLASGARGAVARAAAELLLQRKACVLDAMALTHARVRGRLDESSRVKLDRLAELRRRIAEHALSSQLFGEMSRPGELASLQAEEDDLQAELSHAGAFGVAGVEPVTLAAVQAALPQRAVLVEFLRWSRFDPVRTGRGTPWRGERYAAMVLRGRGQPRWFDLGDANAIDHAADDLRALLRDPESDPDAESVAAVDLYRRLIAPFESLLAGASQLLVAPDGGLNLLPFGVLGAPILAERCVVCHLTSGRELVHPEVRSAPDAEVLVMVDADFDAESDGPPAANPPSGALQLAALPRTRDEARVIESLFARCRILSAAGASVGAVKSIERPALLHIATHGLFAGVVEPPPVNRSRVLQVDDDILVVERAMRSPAANPMLHAGLAFAGANRSAPGRPSGFVTAAELAAIDLRGTELVVLSACDTGLGVTARGGEFAGLRRAFSIAGAAAQVISLWEVEEDATAALMEGFYRRLLAGIGRAEALQQAQLELRRRPRFAHPNAWAAFAAWGAAGPLSAQLRAAAEGTRA